MPSQESYADASRSLNDGSIEHKQKLEIEKLQSELAEKEREVISGIIMNVSLQIYYPENLFVVQQSRLVHDINTWSSVTT